MIIIELVLIMLFLYEILMSQNIIWILFNVFFLILTVGSIFYSVKNKKGSERKN